MKSIDLVAAHMAGDYVFQTDEMATKKLDDSAIRAAHVTRYVLCFVPVVLASRAGFRRSMVFLVSLWLSHYVTDSKRWLPNDDWPPGTIINDQALHAVSLAVLGRLLR